MITHVFCLLLLNLTLGTSSPADEITATHEAEATIEVPARGPCTVCVRRGATHGEEEVVAHRVFQNQLHTFCSEPCAESFDQMPEGYMKPVLPRPSPEVTVTDLEGKEVPLMQDGTRALLVDFWATWCKPCLKTMPVLEELASQQAEKGLRVVGISIDEKASDLKRFLRKREVAYPIAHDTDAENPAWWAYRVPAIPALFLLDGEGNIVEQWSGEVSSDVLRSSVDAVLARP